MRDPFPMMTTCPEGKHITLGALYWVAYLIIIPFFVNLFTIFAFGTLGSAALGTILSMLINFLAIGGIFKEYLQDCWLFAGLHRKEILKTVAIAAGIILVLQIPIQLAFYLISNSTEFLGGFVWLTRILVASPFIDRTAEVFSPLVGMDGSGLLAVIISLCSVILPSLTMSCMYYGVAFAPLCQKKAWLGYAAVLVIGFIIPFTYYWSSGVWSECLFPYISRIPLYLCACWAYQKADNIWAPIAVHGIVNLVSQIPVLIFSIVLVFM